MNLSRVTRIVVWLALLCGFGLCLYLRSDQAWGPDPGAADKGLLLAVTVLLIWPLFAEIDVFGFKIKQQLQAIREELHRAAAYSDSICDGSEGKAAGYTAPLSDDGLERLLVELQAAWGKGESAVFSAFGSRPAAPQGPPAILAAAGRAGAEISRLGRASGLPVRPNGDGSALATAWQLARRRVLTPAAMAAFRELHLIARRVLDGEAVTPAQIRFASWAGVELLGRLSRIQAAGE